MPEPQDWNKPLTAREKEPFGREPMGYTIRYIPDPPIIELSRQDHTKRMDAMLRDINNPFNKSFWKHWLFKRKSPEKYTLPRAPWRNPD